jgi:histidine ammonia-lyase/tyrosine ammonia-lyase
VLFGPDQSITCSALERAALDVDAPLRLSDNAQDALARSRRALDTLLDDGATVYGSTTGFGPLVDYDAADRGGTAHADGLLAHLSTGAGDWTPDPVVRGTALARVQALVQGYSGLRPIVVDRYLDLFRAGLRPAVPTIGSLGASGDLTPLAHIARVLTGDGHVRADGDLVPARRALDAAGLEPVVLEGRDALALVNGTSYMTAYAALAVARGFRLLRRAEALTGWIYRLLGCAPQALDARLHAVRGHDGQQTTAARIRSAAGDATERRAGRPLQEVYSLRCAPQVLGAARDELRRVQDTTETELNGVTDNPVIHPEGPTALHGGNFQGQQIAFVADALNTALTQIGVLAERQVDVLLTPDQTDGAPPLLAWNPGATSGLAGAQLTATALVAEMRHDAQPASTSSIPTNNDNQDVVSMGALAARTAYQQTDRLASILAVLTMACAQLNHLRAADRAEGPVADPPEGLPSFDAVTADRPLRAEIKAMADDALQP